jgi:hypothetical protein
MDPLYYMLLNQRTGHILTDILFMLIAMPFITMLSQTIKEKLETKIGNIFTSKDSKSVEFIGWELLTVCDGVVNFNYPTTMKAICYLLMRENKLKQAQLLDNGFTNRWSNNDPSDTKLQDYVVGASQSFDLGPKIRVEIKRKKESGEKADDIAYKIILSLIAKKDIKDVHAFITEATQAYAEHVTGINKGKIYHFIYQGYDDNVSGCYRWKKSILSDFTNPTRQNFETFNNLFSPHKKALIQDLTLLKDLDYYRRTGSKHKKGYLFYGPPGCGKTASVIAMANHDHRHIIEVPMSRLKTNTEIEDILSLTQIDGVTFRKDQIIILFDEIDSGFENNLLPEQPQQQLTTAEAILANSTAITSAGRSAASKALARARRRDREEDDQISLGTILSRLDGVGSYNGLVIIATTNHIQKLPKEIYRHGRLNPVYFDYLTQDQATEMIETFYNTNLTPSQKAQVPSAQFKVAPSAMRQFIEQHIHSLDELLIFLVDLSPPHSPTSQEQPFVLPTLNLKAPASSNSLALSSDNASED